MKIGSLIFSLTLSQPERERYCREKRLERFAMNGAQANALGVHALAHRVLMLLMRADLYLSGKRYQIIRDDRGKTQNPIIYCPTHIGGADIEMAFAAIGAPCWILLGNPRELYKSIDGMMLELNGWIPMDVQCKEDRAAAKAKMELLLDKGANLLIFPEGTQNISPNALVGHLYAGAVNLAITHNAEIVPIAICRDKDFYYFSIGENIKYSGETKDSVFQKTDELRDRMATLKWELIERLKMQKRRELSKTALKDFVNDVIRLKAEYSLSVDDIRAEQFRPKGVVDADEVFAFMESLEPSLKNAFLFKRTC